MSVEVSVCWLLSAMADSPQFSKLPFPNDDAAATVTAAVCGGATLFSRINCCPVSKYPVPDEPKSELYTNPLKSAIETQMQTLVNFKISERNGKMNEIPRTVGEWEEQRRGSILNRKQSLED